MFKKKPKPSRKLSGMLDVLIKMAKDMLEDRGEFDPMGMIRTSDGNTSFIDPILWRENGIIKGQASNQLLRNIEDHIRKIRRQKSLDCAIIFYDATLRSQDGSNVRDALVGRIEEKNVGAYQVIIEYEIKRGKFKIKSKQFIEKSPHLLPS